MSLHSHPDDLTDLSLRRSLKNWTNHSSPPPDSRRRLLAAAQKEKSRFQPKRLKLIFGWFFYSQAIHHEYQVRSITNYEFEYIDFLKTSMVFL